MVAVIAHHKIGVFGNDIRPPIACGVGVKLRKGIGKHAVKIQLARAQLHRFTRQANYALHIANVVFVRCPKHNHIAALWVCKPVRKPRAMILSPGFSVGIIDSVGTVALTTINQLQKSAMASCPIAKRQRLWWSL